MESDTSQLTLLASDDFAAVAAVIERLSAARSPAFASPVFRPALLMDELFEALHIGPGPRVPPLVAKVDSNVQVEKTAPGTADAGLNLLHETCGSCHEPHGTSIGMLKKLWMRAVIS